MRHGPMIASLSLALAGTLVACGGDATSDHASTDRLPPLSTLVDDNGLPMPSVAAAAPSDPSIRTQHGRYASARQAADYERALGDHLLRVEVGCCEAAAVDRALDSARRARAAQGLPDTAPVLVHGADQRLAAAAADRLAASGHATVWLVTQ